MSIWHRWHLHRDRVRLIKYDLTRDKVRKPVWKCVVNIFCRYHVNDVAIVGGSDRGPNKVEWTVREHCTDCIAEIRQQFKRVKSSNLCSTRICTEIGHLILFNIILILLKCYTIIKKNYCFINIKVTIDLGRSFSYNYSNLT